MADLLRSDRESKKATKLCGHPITVYWSRENNNWLIYDKVKNTLMFEIETGDKINHNEIKRHLRITKDRSQSQNMKDHSYNQKRGREKRAETRRDENRRELESIRDFAGHKGVFQVPSNYRGEKA